MYNSYVQDQIFVLFGPAKAHCRHSEQARLTRHLTKSRDVGEVAPPPRTHTRTHTPLEMDTVACVLQTCDGGKGCAMTSLAVLRM